MYLNRISISGKKMERLVVNLSEECPFRWPFRAEGACLSPNLREAYMILSQKDSIGRFSSLQALQHLHGCSYYSSSLVKARCHTKAPACTTTGTHNDS